MIEWRFDQGRLDYFRFDEIKKIAKGLYGINQCPKPRAKDIDIVRLSLTQETNLPFAPNSSQYPVWRNYGRVFKCLLLATEHNGLICTTDLCADLVQNDEISCDDYLLHFATHFSYPSPAFSGYQPSENRVFPVLAIIRALISKYKETGVNFLDMDEIIYKIASNNSITGIASFSFSQLIMNKEAIKYDPRQIRELVKFISQFSFLSWYENKLFLDITDFSELHLLENQFIADTQPQERLDSLEIMRLGKTNNNFLLMNEIVSLSIDDQAFSEGGKIKVTHLITERNSILRKIYFSKTQNAQICRMCGLDTQRSYEWSEHIIEVHHLLPLSSPVRVEDKTTSLKDLVGICPTCHRATHKYYTFWLNLHKKKDFVSYEEAYHVYEEAKSKVK
ncbi:TPA: HNH endonuclease, partial [Neisseria meningitidis]